MNWIFINGEYVRQEDAKISIYDHSFLFGDGIFEGIRAYSGNVFRLREHVLRLFDSAKALLLPVPYTVEQIENIVLETLSRNKLETAYIRLILTRGEGGGFSLDPFICKDPQFICITVAFDAFPEKYYNSGIEIVTVPTRRNRADVLSPQVKSLNYLNNVLVKIEAINAGVQDGLMLNTEGFVAEGTTQNVFFVKNGIICTPPCSQGALEGITRNAVMELAAGMGITVKEQTVTRHDIYTADEVFMTGTAAEIIGVVKVDGRVIGNGTPGEYTRRLYQTYKMFVLGSEIHTAQH
ncbi:branched-chain-amino-acid transaminase [Paenibacillus oenotherae]|uniref:Branched-chain-amino-acid aminotransferase n=2 Tax=Paenibacillus oenotherae TaxID=1435645 RepID=A0ABS7DBX8_9BACL|nr:branched-chain-amino-acid transaminase [Paenibacillus oenotherae]MBW7477360.1 branched-chain-amino-acid transaminase [Paenibacillus oenotherae]